MIWSSVKKHFDDLFDKLTPPVLGVFLNVRLPGCMVDIVDVFSVLVESLLGSQTLFVYLQL